jgi:hypothetical protein
MRPWGILTAQEPLCNISLLFLGQKVCGGGKKRGKTMACCGSCQRLSL